MPIDSPFDRLAGIASPFGRRSRIEVVPIVITAEAAPSLGALTYGHKVQDGLSAGALDVGNYGSTAGTIQTPTATVTINGVSGALTDEVAFNDEVSVQIVVSDDTGSTRTFNAGTQTVQGIAPTIIASDSLSGRTLTISVDSTTGVPSPSVALTTLTLDGAPLTATSSDPWTCMVPSSGSEQIIEWTLTASNSVSPDATASGLTAVPAHLASGESDPVITGLPIRASTLTVTLGQYDSQDFAASGTLTIDGTPVEIRSFTSGDTSFEYQIPYATDIGAIIEWSETSDLGVTQSTQVKVVIADPSLLPAFDHVWNGSDAFILSRAEYVLELE